MMVVPDVLRRFSKGGQLIAHPTRLFSPLQSFEFDNLAAERYAQIRAELTLKGQLIGANDLLIVAIAQATG